MSFLLLSPRGTKVALFCAPLLLAAALAERTSAAESWVEQGHQIPADGIAGDTFGFVVAIDGDTAVVGSAGHDRGSEDNVGAAYVYTRSNGVWGFQQKLMASDGMGTHIFGDQFGAAVAISGDTIIIGANQDDTATGGNAGSAYIFTRSNGVWTEQQHLFASAGNPGAAFGCTVAIEGDTAVVGSFWEDSSSGTNAGAAYVFKRTGITWALQQRLNPPDTGDGMHFGISVAVSGSYMVIGSHVGAYLFYRSTPNWIFAQKWQALDGHPDDSFGHSVAVHGDIGVVGAPFDDTAAGMDAGSAYIFQIRNGLDPLQQKVTASNAAERDRYGYAVATDGTTVLVGAYNGDTSEGANTGAAYLIRRNPDVWTEKQILKGSDTAINDGFAIGVAMSAGRAIVGAYQHAQLRNGNTIVSGGTYIFGPVLSVNKTADTNDGVCDAADCSLREALTAANSNDRDDTIHFNIPANSPGCIGTKCSIALSSPLIPEADAGFLTVIDGGAGANKIYLSGASARQILKIDAPTSKVSIRNLTFTEGSDPNGGGAILILNGTLTLVDCTLVGNQTASLGGAINCNSGCTLNLTNVTISGNSSNNAGGGIFNSGTATASNCTITNNTTNSSGGGIFNLGTFNIRNTIVGGNISFPQPGVDASGTFSSQGYNLIGKSDGADGFTATGDQTGTNAAPLNGRLSSLADKGGKTLTHALLPNSPAINAGNTATSPAADQRGVGRVGIADIGAFEFNTPPPAVAIGSIVSRKTHGSAGPFDLDLTGSTAVESRSGGANGDHTVIFTFSNPLTSVDGALVSGGTGTVSSAGPGSQSNQYLVNLADIANAQEISIILTNVTDSLGNYSSAVPVSMSILLGDVTGNGSVTSSDVGQAKALSGQPVSGSNFRTDVNLSGGVNASDIGLVKSTAGTQLP